MSAAITVAHARAETSTGGAMVLFARFAFAAIFVAGAPRHFTAEGIHHAADLGVPLADLLVPLSGIMAIVGGLSVIVGYRARWGAWMLVGFLVPVTLMMHAFWKVHDPTLVHVQQAMFMKNLSLLGGALLLAHFGAGPMSVDAMKSRSTIKTE